MLLSAEKDILKKEEYRFAVRLKLLNYYVILLYFDCFRKNKEKNFLSGSLLSGVKLCELGVRSECFGGAVNISVSGQMK